VIVNASGTLRAPEPMEMPMEVQEFARSDAISGDLPDSPDLGAARRGLTAVSTRRRVAFDALGTCVRMGNAGSPYPRFQRALATGSLHLIRAAAAELPRVDLGDALAVCMAIRDAEPERFERAALRWLARYAVEKAGSVADVRAAADAFSAMLARPEDALIALQQLV
jgi:hypothetical protein